MRQSLLYRKRTIQLNYITKRQIYVDMIAVL